MRGPFGDRPDEQERASPGRARRPEEAAQARLAAPSRAKTLGKRVREIQPHEVLIFFVLLVLLALCVVATFVVVRDETPAGGQGRRGLGAAFRWD